LKVTWVQVHPRAGQFNSTDHIKKGSEMFLLPTQTPLASRWRHPHLRMPN
jgi:hypothetical protein